MIRVRQVKVKIDDNSLENIKKCTSKKLNIKDEDIHNLKIIKESIDARGEVSYIYEVEIETNLENKLLKNKDVYVPKDESYKFEITGTKQMKERPIIVGSGPSGLFSAYILSKNGYKPIIIERGEKVEDRVKTIENFWETGKLNKNSNDKTNNIINAVMPFDIENCVKYDSNYLTGYTSERRDINVQQLKNLVHMQAKDIAKFAANDTITNYDRGVSWENDDFLIKGEQWKAAYLPIWLYSYVQIN